MQKTTPFLWFDGRVGQAVKFYRSVFKQSKTVSVSRNGKTVQSATLRLNGQELILFNGGPHYKLTPAFSLMVRCKTQQEVDYYWAKLTKGGEESRCAWLKDKFGLSWQIVPEELMELLGDKDSTKAARVMQAMLKMSKIDIKALKRAHAGK